MVTNSWVYGLEDLPKKKKYGSVVTQSAKPISTCPDKAVTLNVQ